MSTYTEELRRRFDDEKALQILLANKAMNQIIIDVKDLWLSTIIDLFAFILANDTRSMYFSKEIEEKYTEGLKFENNSYRAFMVIQSVLNQFYPNLSMQEALIVVLDENKKSVV